MHEALNAFVSELKNATVVPGVPGDTDWKQHVEEISIPGQVVRVTEDDYYYWLEVLPPRWMYKSHFCFAEGEEPFRLFWQDRNGHYFARQLTCEETLRLCRLAGIHPPAIEASPRFITPEEQALISRHLHPPLTGCCGEGGEP